MRELGIRGYISDVASEGVVGQHLRNEARSKHVVQT